jgi:hypothetical protein
LYRLSLGRRKENATVLAPITDHYVRKNAVTKRLDDLLWKLDELGEHLNALEGDLGVSSGTLPTLTSLWMSLTRDRFDSLYWATEHLKRELTKWEQESVLSAASIVESAEDIAALLLRGFAPTVPDSFQKNISVLLESQLQETLTPSTLSAHPSLLPPSEKGTSSSITPESAEEETATPTSEYSSGQANE